MAILHVATSFEQLKVHNNTGMSSRCQEIKMTLNCTSALDNHFHMLLPALHRNKHLAFPLSL